MDDLLRRIEEVARRRLGERELRIAVLSELRAAIGFDAYAWLLTDPETSVGWSPVAEVPVLEDLPPVIRAKYLTATNRWTGLATGQVVTLLTATGGRPDRSPLWRDWQASYGITDVASAVLRDRFGCWGFVDLWRRGGRYDDAECAVLSAVFQVVTPVLRRTLLATFAESAGEPVVGPAVLLLGGDLRPVAQTGPAAAHLEALLPGGPGRAAVPAAAFNVGGQLCAVEAGVDDGEPQARVYVPGRSWMTVRAGRISATAEATIAVTFDVTDPVERTTLYTRAAGLTGREADVLRVVTAGHDTRHVAQRLGISEHTVQDHLKAIFAKTGADSRRQLMARAVGTHP